MSVLLVLDCMQKNFTDIFWLLWMSNQITITELIVQRVVRILARVIQAICIKSLNKLLNLIQIPLPCMHLRNIVTVPTKEEHNQLHTWLKSTMYILHSHATERCSTHNDFDIMTIIPCTPVQAIQISPMLYVMSSTEGYTQLLSIAASSIWKHPGPRGSLQNWRNK